MNIIYATLVLIGLYIYVPVALLLWGCPGGDLL